MEAALNKKDLPVDATEKTTEAAAPNTRKRWMIFGAVALVALSVIGVYLLVTAGKESTDDAQVEADVVPLAPRVGGLVTGVAVEENQHVKKGQPLLTLDPTDYQAHLAQAEAEVTTAQAQADAADAQFQVIEASAKGGFSSAQAVVSGSTVGVSSADAQIAGAKAALLHAQAEAKKAQLDLGRAEQLRAANAIPQERLDNARLENESAKAALAGAQAQLRAAQEARAGAVSKLAEARGRLSQSQPIDQQIAAAKAQADLAHAKVKVAQAALTLAKNQLEYTQIVAPSDGIVSKLTAHEGQLLQPGQAFAELVPEETYVIANFKETQIGDMHPGQEVEVKIDAYSGKTLEGRVTSLSGGTGARFSLIPPDNASGNFVKVVQRVPVRIDWVQVPEGLPLRAGLSADVTVDLHTNIPAPQLHATSKP